MSIPLICIKCGNSFVIKLKGQRRLHLRQFSKNGATQIHTGAWQEQERGCTVHRSRVGAEENLHRNLSMIFPPHNVAKAILTANTEILPWPSLFNDNNNKKMMLFKIL